MLQEPQQYKLCMNMGLGRFLIVSDRALYNLIGLRPVTGKFKPLAYTG